MLTIHDLKSQNLILLECISGSKAYGLDTPTSDTDIKGVFYLPKSYYYGLHKQYIPQIANETNDIVYYELGRFIELLLQNNPNMMELLATPSDKILYKHPLMNYFKPEWFISKLCMQTFAGFATAQIKKARGFNKKIVNPIAKEKKNILDFCVVFQGGQSIDVKKWLEKNHLEQSQMGLSAMPHATQMYAMFVDDGTMNFSGIIRHEDNTQVLLSSIPKGLNPIAYLSFNQMGFSKYCNDYQAYWHWVEHRNEQRYQTTEQHGKGYDSKNMMHTIRLLQTALDIAQTGQVNVKRANRDELLAIKAGNFEYDALIVWAERLEDEIKIAFQQSSLPAKPDENKIVQTLAKIREQLYAET
ncbi:DNA polymerase beta superfamily protein [Moraxella sp. ZY210820]|uniref:nucleotidyltransferase domain-containing protein n=1 Tax=unclassified Moraxella TaxID=2685852 RepID=UPI0027312F4F|nr:nucleotidyltransferase domain-containing protein [Moraxella sp. ZY210820]WLF83949.1 nucleotidyltransferase domain-containing protein [Moraxella sp. ZY210820]